MRFWEIDSAQDLLSDCRPHEAFCAARRGEAYALYFPNGGEVKLDLTDTKNAFVARWIDIGTGAWGPTAGLQGGTSVAIAAPGDGHWAIGIVKR
jgi:hypothetical protein